MNFEVEHWKHTMNNLSENIVEKEYNWLIKQIEKALSSNPSKFAFATFANFTASSPNNLYNLLKITGCIPPKAAFALRYASAINFTFFQGSLPIVLKGLKSYLRARH